MVWQRVSTVDDLPADPVGEAVAEALAEMLFGATVELVYVPDGELLPVTVGGRGTASATGAGPPGWQLSVVVALHDRVARLVELGQTSLVELLAVLPEVGLHTAARFRPAAHADGAAVSPPLRRAVRDTIAAEVLARFLATRVGREPRPDLVAEIIEYLVELSGTTVEAHDVTHGVIVADALHEAPRLRFRYPADVRTAKRAPLLFDGQRSVLVVDPDGRARTELQRHRFDRLAPAGTASRTTAYDGARSGSLVADATRVLGGLGFFGRANREIRTFVDGRPLLVRRAEHWTAFPLELTTSISDMIGGGDVAGVVARAALTISAGTGGAILAIVDDAADLDGIVAPKDRYDLRDEIDRVAMRPETRLHHLIDAEELDEHALVRLATLDGATVVDREGRLLAYGAIVTSSESQEEGARTAAARTLSTTAAVVLKVSADGDLTIFREGAVVTTLLGRPAQTRPRRG